MMENQYSVKEEVYLFVSLLCDSITLTISLSTCSHRGSCLQGRGGVQSR